MTEVAQVQMRSGYAASRLIRGGWQLAGGHGAVEAARAAADMVAFYDAGITTFDCADIYTGVEEIYGEGLRLLADQRGAEAAARVRIHTKYVPDFSALATLSAADVRRIITRSCVRLGRERLDLVQFFWWSGAVPGMVDAVGHLADLQAEGLIDRIGVTNFDQDQIADLSARADIVSAQVQFSVLDRRPKGDFARWCAANDVAVICYGVLAGGFLTDHWLGKPDPGFEFENRSLIKYRLIIEEFGGWDAFQALLTTLRGIADRRGGDIAAVATRAMMDDVDVTACIIGARYARHLPRLLAALDVQMDDADRAEIAALQAAAPGPAGPVYGLERDRDGPHGRIMKYDLNDGPTAGAA